MSVRPIGGLLIFDLQGQGAWVYATYEPFNYSNVRLDVKVNNRGSNNNNVSLICRKSDAGWYEFDIANNGLYEILFAQIQPDNTVSYTLMAEGGSTKIRSGLAENEYSIVCQDNILTLYINGTESRRLEDKKYLLPEGKVGISVSSFKDVPIQQIIIFVRLPVLREFWRMPTPAIAPTTACEVEIGSFMSVKKMTANAAEKDTTIAVRLAFLSAFS
jgi:hypothetical protein